MQLMQSILLPIGSYRIQLLSFNRQAPKQIMRSRLQTSLLHAVDYVTGKDHVKMIMMTVIANVHATKNQAHPHKRRARIRSTYSDHVNHCTVLQRRSKKIDSIVDDVNKKVRDEEKISACREKIIFKVNFLSKSGLVASLIHGSPTVTLINPDTSAVVDQLEGPNEIVNQADISHDDKYVVAGTIKGSIVAWDWPSRSPIQNSNLRSFSELTTTTQFKRMLRHILSVASKFGLSNRPLWQPKLDAGLAYFTSSKITFPAEPMQTLSPADFPFVRTEEVLTLHINNKQLPFPLPYLSPYKKLWSGSEARAPFLNREKILLELLHAAYVNFADPGQKPFCTVQTMNPGQGKTRLLMEWSYHALNDPHIIEQFLSEQPLPGIWSNRKAFINALYKAVFMQRMIVSKGNQLKQREIEAVKEMIKANIFTRFGNKQLTISGNTPFDITYNSLTSMFQHAKLTTCVDLFNACVDKFCKPPTEYPFDVPHVDRNMLIFGLDECQGYSEKSEGTLKEDLVCKLVTAASGERSEFANTSAFWLVTGTIIPGSFPSTPTHYQLVKASMENLLHIKYLDTIAKQYFGKALPGGGSDNVLAYETAQTLVRLFYRSLGVPRGIEVMLETAHAFLVKMENFFATKLSTASSSELFSHGQMKRELEAVSAKLDEKLSYLFPNTTREALFRQGILQSTEKESQQCALELLDIKAALCLEMRIKDKIPGLNLEPQILEEAGYLIQWTKIDEQNKQYTRPFLYTYEAAFAPLPLLQTIATSLHWTPFDISLAMLILHPNCSTNLDDGNKQGKCFEQALAASIYARYKVESQGQTEVELQQIFKCQGLPAELHTAKGVVVLKKQFSFSSADLLREIEEKHVLTIDGESSEFADIVLPAKINGNTIFIGFQTKQNKGKTKVAKNALTVLKAPNFYFIAVASVVPETAQEIHATMISLTKKSAINCKKALFTDAEKDTIEMTRRVSVLNASAILSPIYQSYFGFAPVFKDTKFTTPKEQKRV